MSTSPESGSSESLGLDLDLHFLPAWAQKPTENQYAKFEGGQDPSDRRRDRGDRRERRPGPPRHTEGRPPGQGPRGIRGPGPQREGGRPRFHDRGGRPDRPPEAPLLEI